MSRAGVFLSEIDISTTVRSATGFYGSVQLKAPKGLTDKAVLFGRDTKLLQDFTTNNTVPVGYDDTIWTALAYLQKADKLWGSRVQKNSSFASAKIFSLTYNDFTNGTLLTGGVTVNETTDEFTTTDTNLLIQLQTGMPVRFTTTTFLPTGIVAGTTYYAVKTGDKTFKVAATQADALAVTPVTINLIAVQKSETVASISQTADSIDLSSVNLDPLIVTGNIGYFTTTDTLPTPLQVNTNYYIRRVDSDTFRVSTTLANANIADIIFTTNFGVNANNITSATAHNLSVNQPIQFKNTGGALPSPVVANTTYYVKTVVSPTVFTISATIAGLVIAFTDDGTGVHSFETGFIDFTSAGSGTHTFNIVKDLSVHTAVTLLGKSTVLTDTFTASATTDEITLTGTGLLNSLTTGTQVSFTTTGSLPSPLQPNTYYYLIEISPGIYQVADSLDNAINSFFINLLTTGTGVQTIKIKLIDPDAYNFNAEESLLFYNANPGAWGNALAIKLKDNREKVPDSFVVEVYQLPNLVTPVERPWVVSRKSDAKDGFNKNIFIENILKQSRYIRCNNNELIDGEVFPLFQATTLRLLGGDAGDQVTEGDLILDLQSKFSNRDRVPNTVFMDGANNTVNYQRELLAISELRGDSVGILSIPLENELDSDYLNSVVDYRRRTLNANSSWGAIYSPHFKIFDKYNTREDIIVSPSGYIGGLISETGTNLRVWYPVAGKRRGVVTNVNGLVREYDDAELDFLYDNGINPIRFIEGEGIFIWGQKTLLTLPSALDRLNVRMLLTVIEPAVRKTLDNFVFEFNDEATRADVTGILNNFLITIQAERGLYAFGVICSDVNNDNSDIDNYTMNVWIFLKPTKAAEFIPVKVVITRTDVSFSLAAELIA